MYNPNNQLKQPDIYAILNTEDPAIEGPIDTDALVKDIFDTNYSTSNEFNFNHDIMNFDITSQPQYTLSNPSDIRRHSVGYFNPHQNYQPASRSSSPFGNNTPPQPLFATSTLDTVVESEHRSSMPNIFLSDESRRQLNTSIQQRSKDIQFNPLPWSEPSRKRYYSQQACPLPMSGIMSRRTSMATPNDICTWNRMVDEESRNKKSKLEEQDYPVITETDLEAAKKDPNAIPRKQKLRYEGDQYTPKWVRYTGQSKEGYCDTCKPGKWLQLKNSAYWYHKQFFHGISSVSGKEFQKPLEQRAGDHDVIEGLCHQCRLFVPICNSKRKNSVLWYRHAHKCHIYDKPKTKSNKRVSVPVVSPPNTQPQPIY